MKSVKANVRADPIAHGLIPQLENLHLYLTMFQEVIRMARGRTVKDPPKRGKLTERQVQRAVEKVLHAKRRGGAAGQAHQEKKKKK